MRQYQPPQPPPPQQQAPPQPVAPQQPFPGAPQQGAGPYSQPPNPQGAPPPSGTAFEQGAQYEREPVAERTARYEREPESYDFEPEPYDPPRSSRHSRREPEPPPYEPEPSRRGHSERSYEETRARREDRARMIATGVHLFTGLIATVFVLHIVFVIAGANQSSGIVSFVYSTAKIFVFGFGDVFTPGDATIGLVLNYGLAAIVYVILGRVIAGALRRR